MKKTRKKKEKKKKKGKLYKWELVVARRMHYHGPALKGVISADRKVKHPSIVL